jgi:hypothetical protein
MLGKELGQGRFIAVAKPGKQLFRAFDNISHAVTTVRSTGNSTAVLRFPSSLPDFPPEESRAACRSTTHHHPNSPEIQKTQPAR